ncbi:MAG TPA: CPCC family cysteine-rich protein [Phycisphaerae bacterium]|nr:CPCC family cysteine-rich protein [Phycisphaerae bacterium]
MARYAWLCCGYLTLDEEPPGTFDICSACGREDDNVQAANPEYRGGANRVSLRQAKENFARLGASKSERLPPVRSPRTDELPPDQS